MVRKQITKKLRFEVFKRDGFSCQYCGKTPPEVTLEIDHIKPVSRRGTNNINNLITACFDCNRGKSNIELCKIPNTIIDNIETLKEQQRQLDEYQKLINKIENRYKKQASEINDIYSSWNSEYELSDKFLNSTVKNFLKKIPFVQVKDAMNNACSRVKDSSQCIKYFCGICWNIIREEIK